VPRTDFMTLDGYRVVAQPPAIELLLTDADVHIGVRIADDEAFVVATRNIAPFVRDDHAIVEPDSSFSHSVMDERWLREHLLPALEWQWPDTASVGQGLLHQIPVKLVRARGMTVLLCPTTLVHELEERL
jgi:hypothetical protein